MEQSEIIRSPLGREQLVALAREAGDWNGQTAEFNDVGLERFAALVAAHEREKLRCAIILNDDGGTYSTHESKEQLEWMLNMSPAKEVIEAAVLAEREAFAKESLEVLESLRKETIAQCQQGMVEAYKLGQSEEREACAKVCEENRWGNLGAGCAAAIRARSE